MKYRPEVDGLRAVAILPVVLFHAGIVGFSGGFIGVDVFFVISGYLITSIIIGDLEKERFTFKQFYERRARRILPALFFVIAACLPFAWLWMSPYDLKEFAQSIMAVSVFVSNFFFWKDNDYFGTDAELKPLLHTWSLSIEEQFYIFFPIALLFIWKYARNRLGIFIIMGFIGSILLAEYQSRFYPRANFFLLPTRGWELLIGAYLAYLEVNKKLYFSDKVAAFLSNIGLLLIAFSVFFFNEKTRHPSLVTFLPTIGTALILAFGRVEGLTKRLLSIKAVVFIGLLSYPLYLWHQPIFAFARIYLPTRPSIMQYVILIIISALFAYISYRFIEKPFRDKNRIQTKTIFRVSVSAGIVALAVGFWGDYTKGFPSRYSENALVIIKQFDALAKERLDQSSKAVCHYSEQFVSDINVFLNQWSCLEKDSVLIVGDSHAADRATSLRLNNIRVSQMTGAGCALAPSLMRDNCKAIFSKLKNTLKTKHQDMPLLLVNQFKPNELTPEHINEMIKYWSEVSSNIYLFTNMPEYPRIKIHCLKASKEDSDNCFYNLEYDSYIYESVFPLINTEQVKSSMTLINTHDLWCELNKEKPCSPTIDKQLLLTDYGHHSILGAKLFGALLVKHYPNLFNNAISQH